MNLLLFNLKTDSNDDALGFTTDWINALAPAMKRIDVVTMSQGKVDVLPNVQVYSVGKERGYSEARRLFVFYALLFKLLWRNKYDVCFAHMNHLFAVMGWPLLALRRIPIVLWYAHRATPPLLYIAEKVVKRVLASTAEGFRLKSDKKFIIGQGISIKKFQLQETFPATGFMDMLSVARLSKIKKIDIMVEALALLLKDQAFSTARLVLLGSALTPEDEIYSANLKKRIEVLGIQEHVVFAGSVPHEQVATWLAQARLSINMAPTGAIDKAGLESLAAGVPLVFANESYRDIFKKAGVADDDYFVASDDPTNLAKALRQTLSKTPEQATTERKCLSDEIIKHHGLPQLAQKVIAHLTEICCKRSTQ